MKNVNLLPAPVVPITEVLFDLDGVMVALEECLCHLEGLTLDELKVRKAELKLQDPNFDLVVHLIRKYLYTNRVFETALPTIAFTQLYDFVKHFLRNGIRVGILSSGTSASDIYPEVKLQKENWLHKRHMDLLPTFIVQGSKEKYKYARPGVVLVDDYSKNIDEFNKAGGTGILFDGNMKNFVSELQKLHLL